MKEYRNIFKEQTHDELLKLYGQFLEAEKLGYIPDNELGKIREEYAEYFSANVLMMIQFDLTHLLADLWYENERERMKECLISRLLLEKNMGDKTIRQGDFILITDLYEGSRYLKIGEVINIDVYPDGNIKEYTVRFGYDYDTCAEDLTWYDNDLPCKCRVLQFETR